MHYPEIQISAFHAIAIDSVAQKKTKGEPYAQVQMLQCNRKIYIEVSILFYLI